MKTQTDETRATRSAFERLYCDAPRPKQNEPSARPETARLAVYSANGGVPEVIEVGAETPRGLVRDLSSAVFERCADLDSDFPFDVVLAVVENLVHADFRGVTVSVLRNGNTLKVSDRGPGIADKKGALEVGFTTATPSQRETIRGVGSGLAFVADYLSEHRGSLTIDDNLRGGTVITMTLPAENEHRRNTEDVDVPQPRLTKRQKKALFIITELGAVGPSQIAAELSAGLSSAYRDLAVLEDAGLVSCDKHGKRSLTDFGVTSLDKIINS